MLTERWMRRLIELPEAEQRARLASMSPEDLLRFDAWYEAWAHAGQLPPSGEGWRVWLMMAGRGYGKTRAGAEWIAMLARQRRPLRIALVGATIGEARRVMVEGRSGLLAVARNAKVRLTWEPSLNRLKWPGGAQAQLFSGDNADGLRGPEHHLAWCAANAGPCRRGCCRGTAAGCSASHADCRFLLHRRRIALWCVGGPSRLPRRDDCGGLAVCDADRGAGGIRPVERTDCSVSNGRVGIGNASRR